MKEYNPFASIKNVSTLQIASNLNKYEQQRNRLLKQLQQLGLDLSEYEHLPLKQLTAKTEIIMNNTYSIKYLGLKENQMGIISRRINPLVDKELKIQEQTQQTYTVHKYFYPKPLKTGKRGQSIKTINVQNLESEIKKEFEEKKQQLKKQKENSKDQKLKTKMLGSWYSASCNELSKLHKKSRQKLVSPQYLGNSITPKVDPTQSFSRFLNKGILIVRD